MLDKKNCSLLKTKIEVLIRVMKEIFIKNISGWKNIETIIIFRMNHNH